MSEPGRNWSCSYRIVPDIFLGHLIGKALGHIELTKQVWDLIGENFQ